MAIARIAIFLAALFSFRAPAWTCEQLLASIAAFDRGPTLRFFKQQLLMDFFGVDKGYCTAACLTSLESFLSDVIDGKAASPSLGRAVEIVNELKKVHKRKDPTGVTPKESSDFLRGRTGDWAGLVRLRHLVAADRFMHPDVYGKDADYTAIVPSDILGTSERDVPISTVTIEFTERERSLGAHTVMLIPVDRAAGRIRVIDSRLSEREIYARVEPDGNFLRLIPEDGKYVNYYRGRVRANPESLGIRIVSATVLHERREPNTR